MIGDDCSTLKLKSEALEKYIWKTYKPSGSVMFLEGDDEAVFEVGFSQPDNQRYCEGIVKITDDCRVSGFDKLECKFSTE